MSYPDPTALYPLAGFKNTVFLKPLLDQQDGIGNVTIGDYSYYSDFEDPSRFFQDNLLYNFGFSGASFSMGSYCALAHGVRFIMQDANHAMAGPSTYPFPIFGQDWADRLPLAEMPFPTGGDISIGHDVWFGFEATVMPGVTIGNGAVIGAKAVVTKDVPDYAVVAGNPAKVVRQRFSDAEVELLNRLAWWHWSQDKLAPALPLVVKGSVAELEAYYEAEIQD